MFDRQAFIDNILDHYEHPRHRGPMPDATVSIKGGNPGCGDIVRVYLTVDEDGQRIKDVHWTGEGCTISQASASQLMELLDEEQDGHPSLEHITELDYNVLQDVLGKETMQLRPRCATLALGTLKQAIRKYQREQLMREHGIDPATYGRG